MAFRGGQPGDPGPSGGPPCSFSVASKRFPWVQEKGISCSGTGTLAGRARNAPFSLARASSGG